MHRCTSRYVRVAHLFLQSSTRRVFSHPFTRSLLNVTNDENDAASMRRDVYAYQAGVSRAPLHRLIKSFSNSVRRATGACFFNFSLIESYRMSRRNFFLDTGVPRIRSQVYRDIYILFYFPGRTGVRAQNCARPGRSKFQHLDSCFWSVKY